MATTSSAILPKVLTHIMLLTLVKCAILARMPNRREKATTWIDEVFKIVLALWNLSRRIWGYRTSKNMLGTFPLPLSSQFIIINPVFQACNTFDVMFTDIKISKAKKVEPITFCTFVGSVSRLVHTRRKVSALDGTCIDITLEANPKKKTNEYRTENGITYVPKYI